MGMLGDFLMGGISGAATEALGAIKEQDRLSAAMAQFREQLNLQSQARLQEDEIRRTRDRDAKIAEEQRYTALAEESASRRSGLLAQQARSRVADVPDAEGQKRLEDAISQAESSGAYKQDVTPLDMARARGDYKSEADMIQRSEQNATHATERMQDQAWKEKDYELREKQLGVSLANAREAALERQENRENKKAVKELFDVLTHYVDAGQTGGSPEKYDAQIKRTIVELRKYGVDVSDMLYGKANKTGEVETEKTTPDGVSKIKTDTYSREGGVLPNQKPGPGGKPLDIQPGINGEYKTKDGKTFWVPYKQ